MPKGVIPLHTCVLARTAGVTEPIFELQSTEIKRKTFFGSVVKGATPNAMYFMADSEQELQEWVTPSKAAIGVDPMRKTNIHLNTSERVARVLRLDARNKEGDTALHVLASSAVGSGAEQQTIELLQTANWLAVNGCPCGEKNKASKSAAQLATESGKGPLAALLAAKDPSRAVAASRSRHPLLEPPPMYPAYTYFSLNFDKHVAGHDRYAFFLKNMARILFLRLFFSCLKFII